MMKQVYLTFDIETIVARFSRNSDYHAGVYWGTLFLAEELKKRGLKGTFFVSLSSKQKGISHEVYFEMLVRLVVHLKSYPNIKLAPHIHAYGLPVPFNCPSDKFKDYNYTQQRELLLFARERFRSWGIDADCFRPGGFSTSKDYYRVLEETGFRYSSIMEGDCKPVIDMEIGAPSPSCVYSPGGNITEYPITSVRVKSIKGRYELLNLSPDFFTLESVRDYLEKLEYICVNFHSFSVFLNRNVRENHSRQLANNLRFFFFERPLTCFSPFFNLRVYNDQTIMRQELLNWLDYFADFSMFQTYFIGE